jgi:isopentenyldiphosphate isomerase
VLLEDRRGADKMEEELIDIYDENLRKIGVMSRSEAHRTGAWHRSIHCWIVRPVGKGYVLFQKRGSGKKLFPNLLDITAAGHYKSGETVENGIREIAEELGLDVEFDDLIPMGIKIDVAKVNNIINREFCDVFLMKRKDAPAQYNINPMEVEGLVQMRIDDGIRLFSGEEAEVMVKGVEWSKDAKSWKPVRMKVSVKDFVPRVDPYYYKVFIMARLYMRGEKYISI